MAAVSQFDICHAGIASFSLWEIWVARCGATFEWTKMNARRICLRVIARVQLLSLITAPTKPAHKVHPHILGITGIHPKPLKVKRGLWCKWSQPNLGRYKLNIDGSARNGIVTSGGVIWDATGNLLAMFSNYHGPGTITKVEFMALLDGLNLCRSLGVTEIDIESDSQVVVHAMTGKHARSWEHTYTLRRCLELWYDSMEIRHVFRQANTVADSCAAWAHSHRTRREGFLEVDLPHPIFSALKMDRLGIYSFRP